MARQQTLVQLTEELVAALDERAATERRSRSELVREAIERYLADDLQARIGAAIVEGYAECRRNRTSTISPNGPCAPASLRSRGDPRRGVVGRTA